MSNYTFRRTRLTDAVIRGNGPYEALVVNHLDPYMMGSLEVELLKHNSATNTPERSGQLITVKYLSPFYGVTPASGLKSNDGYENTQKSYGFWAVPPDFGTRVLVIFAEGNSSYGFWIGCIQDSNMNFMVPDGRASTTITTDDTPETLRGKKLPVGEYNKLIETGDRVDPNFFKKPYNRDFTKVLEIQGLLGDEARGTTTSSARRETPSMVFGMSTPGPLDKRRGNPKARYGEADTGPEIPYNRLGGHSFVMDDGDDKFVRATHAEDGPPIYLNKERGEEGGDETIPQNELFRIRTRTGHQIVLHNSEDFIYITNSRGTAWIELTSDGKIDIHAQDSISIATDNDINFSAERDFNIEAGRNINMKASARWSDGKAEECGSSSGRIQMESQFATNIGGENLTLSPKNFDLNIDGDYKVTVNGSYHLNATSHIYQTSGGATHLTSKHSFYRTSGSNINDQVAGHYALTAQGVISNTSFESIHNKASNTIHSIAGVDIKNTASTGTIHNIAELDIRNSANTGSIHSIAEVDWYLQTNGNINNTTAGAFKNTAAGDFSIGAANSTIKGGNINFNSPGDVPVADLASAATSAVPSIRATPAQIALTADRINNLSSYSLPASVNPPVPFPTILPRIPMKEPWPHHENLNPLAYKKDQTDREAIGSLVTADTFVTPDTFSKNAVDTGTTVRLTGSGGNIHTSTLDYDDTTDGGFEDIPNVGFEPGEVDPALARAAGLVSNRPWNRRGTDTEFIKYKNNGARNLTLEPRLEALLEAACKEAGVFVNVVSGGQMPRNLILATPGHRKNEGYWEVPSSDGRYKRVATGSVRHDYGSGADLDIFDKETGRQYQLGNSKFDNFIFQFFALGGQAGGCSAGYMGIGRPHLDIVGTDRGGSLVWESGSRFRDLQQRGFAARTKKISSQYGRGTDPLTS